jgi:hypothetical protein
MLRVLAVSLGASLIAWHVPTPWRLLAQTRDISEWIDASRVDSARSDHAVGVWLRLDYARPEPVPGRAGQRYSETLLRFAVDCGAERVRNLEMNLILGDGSALRMTDLDSTAAPVAFDAHPMGRGAFVAVCGWLHAPERYRPVIVDTSVVSH